MENLHLLEGHTHNFYNLQRCFQYNCCNLLYRACCIPNFRTNIHLCIVYQHICNFCSYIDFCTDLRFCYYLELWMKELYLILCLGNIQDIVDLMIAMIIHDNVRNEAG